MYDIFFISNNVDKRNSFRSKYPDCLLVDTNISLEEIKEKAFTKFFWLVYDDFIITENFKFDYRVSEWDKDYIHIWKNGEYFDGITLFPKSKSASEKEFKNRFYINDKKEIDEIASYPEKFDVFNISSYNEYLECLKNSKTNMFYVVWSDIQLIKELDHQVPYYDQNINHVFLNDQWYNGVVLFSKQQIISNKEFTYRFYKTRKEIEIEFSKPKPYDIFFISYNEINADSNFLSLTDRFPRAKRITGIKGIHNAHKEAARLSETEMFWVVDADAVIDENFNFESPYYPHYDSGNRKEHLSTVYIWQSKNPINDLVYGYGGVKLLPKDLILEMKMDTVDMTTSISDKTKIISKISNITSFNTSPFETWKSAFRECVKLSSKIIDRNYDQENEVRLKIWMEKGIDKPFGKYSLEGAKAGYLYGSMNLGNDEKLLYINDFEWLKSQFIEWQKENEQ